MKKALLSLTLWTSVAFIGGYYMGSNEPAPIVVNHYHQYYPLESQDMGEYADYYYDYGYDYTPAFLLLPQEKVPPVRKP